MIQHYTASYSSVRQTQYMQVKPSMSRVKSVEDSEKFNQAHKMTYDLIEGVFGWIFFLYCLSWQSSFIYGLWIHTDYE